MALFGKLPGHGDFVRRGDPALVGRLDAWLTQGLDQLVTADPDAGARLAVFPVWCFRLPDGTTGALAPGVDRVGRDFPIVACITAGGDAEGIADTIGVAIDADTLQTALQTASLSPATPGEAGWWRRDGATVTTSIAPGLPTGDAFAALILAEP